MKQANDIIVSGIRSTGNLHLGNYFGAIHQYVHMQEHYPCYFFVADFHSLTTHPDPKDLQTNVFRVVAENIAGGIDPNRAVLYAQSDVPEIPELYLLMNMLAYKGELEKVPTFKDKVRLNPDNVNAGLLTYPVLMAADILIHKGTKVPVGKDQEQHLEMARNFAQRFNSRYQVSLFPEPMVFRHDKDIVRIMSLDGAGKMSKSENVNATIYLNDTDEVIRKKIKRAKTADNNSIGENKPMPDNVQNLFTLLQLTGAEEVHRHFLDDYRQGRIRYGDFKAALADELIRFIAPIRAKAQELQEDKEQIRSILKAGAEQARASASRTLSEARKAMGIHYY